MPRSRQILDSRVCELIHGHPLRVTITPPHTREQRKEKGHDKRPAKVEEG